MKDDLAGLEARVATLRRCPFLAELGEPELRALARAAESRPVAGGETVFERGGSGSRMYVIAEGEARVHDGEVTWAVLGAGEVFGEMAVLDSEYRTASVSVTRDSLLLGIEREAFFDVLSADPGAFRAVLRAVLRREREIVEEIKNRSTRLLAFQKEMEIGRKIQASFLPGALPTPEGWEIAAGFEAAREVAGDFYDAYALEAPGQVALVIGDVCDKGVGAALFMTLFRSLIRASSLYGFVDPAVAAAGGQGGEAGTDALLANAIRTTNRYVATTHGASSMFASVFAGALDTRRGVLHYVNAGHEAPFIVRAGGGIEMLEVTGGVVGLFAHAPYATATASLGPGDLLLMHTDGVNEAKNAAGEQFGDDRIAQVLEKTRGANAQVALDAMRSAVGRFRGRADPSDDVTLLVVRRLPET